MVRPFITIGDKTSHGGTVIGADFTCDINGKYLARVGDMVVCPKKGCRGIFPIVSGASDMISMGQAPARHGDKTACGATLISSQVVTTWSDESSLGRGGTASNAGALSESSAHVAAEAPTICLDCLAKAAAAGSAMVVRA